MIGYRLSSASKQKFYFLFLFYKSHSTAQCRVGLNRHRSVQINPSEFYPPQKSSEPVFTGGDGRKDGRKDGRTDGRTEGRTEGRNV